MGFARCDVHGMKSLFKGDPGEMMRHGDSVVLKAAR